MEWVRPPDGNFQLQGEQMSVCPSVRPSVRPSVCHNIFLSHKTARTDTRYDCTYVQ